MKRLPLIALALAPGFVAATSVAAQADTPPSVLGKLAPLKQGTLPRILVVYGTVASGSSARHTQMAPLQAAVTDVYVRAGELVKKGAPLVKLTPSPASISAYTQAQSALRVASSLVTRTRSLVGSHLATDQQLFDAEKSEADAKAALAALTAEGAKGAHRLRAPFDAIVTVVSATPGAIVAEGAPLVELARPNGLLLKAGVVPNEAASIDNNDPVRLTPVGGGAALTGHVLFRGSLVDTASGLVPVDISVPQGKALLGEMFRADVTVGHIKGYVVPHHAILVDDAGATYVVQSHNLVAHKVKVRVLGTDDDSDVIAGPVDAASPLVVAGAYQMDNGTHIRLAADRTAAADPKGK